MTETHVISSINELGEGYGFRKIRTALGIDAFGVNAIVMPPQFEAFWHFHDIQDELYLVHAGQARIEIGDPDDPEIHELEVGGLAHVRSTTPRRISNTSETDDLVMIVIGGKDGYVERDGQLLKPDDLERRASFGSNAST